jgi:hypothetical protein
MTFQTPVTVEQMLPGIHHKDYLLPAIQREFVWDANQIRRLVDSLLRGYPIGSFLVWKVEPETAARYTFYDFLTHYHERDNPYASKATVPNGQGILAILDGQQRLTALNIAVYGSHAEKRKYAWWNNPDAFPKKKLYLNLLADPDPDDLGLRYDLRFLTDTEAQASDEEPDGWYPLRSILSLADAGPAMQKELRQRRIDLNDTDPYQRLYDLHVAIRKNPPINYYLETSQDLNKVLDIFVRVNSGGTTLSWAGQPARPDPERRRRTRQRWLPGERGRAGDGRAGQVPDLRAHRDRRATRGQVRRAAHLRGPGAAISRSRPDEAVPRGPRVPAVPVHQQATPRRGHRRGVARRLPRRG